MVATSTWPPQTGIGVWVDNSDQTPDETVEEIVGRLDLQTIA